MLEKVYDAGIRPDHCYAAGFASILLSFAAFGLSKGQGDHDKAQADRWGIFVGHWAPTFFGLGNALKLRENS